MNKIELIQRAVCEVWGVTLAELKGRSRDSGICDARHASMGLCKALGAGTREEIGTAHGGRAPNSVDWSGIRVSELMSVDTQLRRWPSERRKQNTMDSAQMGQGRRGAHAGFDDTWNWSIGCSKVSPGCKNCYAEVSTPVRVARSKGNELWGGTLRQRASKATFEAPLRWNKKPEVCDRCGTARALEHSFAETIFGPCEKCGNGATFHRRRVFSLSLGDWLDEAIPIETLADALDVIRRCPNLDSLLLTKRPENALNLLFKAAANIAEREPRNPTCAWIMRWLDGQPPSNVWIGATIENQEYADKRIPELLKIPAVCRFLSVEPMLGPIEFSNVSKRSDAVEQLGKQALTGIHWVICGGESGPHARPFNVEWARSMVAQCRAAGVACFVKQLGAKPEWKPFGGPNDGSRVGYGLKDKKGGDPLEWPEDLRVREFPIVQPI